MAGLFDDARKTAVAAAGLIAVALFITDRGGTSESVVAQAEQLARERGGRSGTGSATGPALAPVPTATRDPANWFAVAPEEDEPVITPPAAAGGPSPSAPPAFGQVHRPEPTGRDFPPGLHH